MQQYELTLVLRPEFTEENADEIIKSLEVSVVDRQVWGKRLLSYSIDNVKEGLYVFFVINISKDRVKDIERAMILHDNVLRHLLVRSESDIKE